MCSLKISSYCQHKYKNEENHCPEAQISDGCQIIMDTKCNLPLSYCLCSLCFTREQMTARILFWLHSDKAREHCFVFIHKITDGSNNIIAILLQMKLVFECLSYQHPSSTLGSSQQKTVGIAISIISSCYHQETWINLSFLFLLTTNLEWFVILLLFVFKVTILGTTPSS